MAESDSNVVSYNEFYQERRKEGRVNENISIQSSPTPAQETGVPQVLGSLRDAQGAENQIVQPEWTRRAHEVTEWLQKEIPGLQCGCHPGQIDKKKPYIGFWPERLIDSSNVRKEYFVGVGDCKGNDWTGESAAEKGQMMLYMKWILLAQPSRTFVPGFVTNNSIIQLVKAEWDKKQTRVQWRTSKAVTFTAGMMQFHSWLKEAFVEFSEPIAVEGAEVQIGELLGRGGSCRVFAGTLNTESVMVKLYKSKREAENESKRLQEVPRDLRFHVEIPECLLLSGKRLVCRPLATPFSTSTLKAHHIPPLFRALKELHACHKVHWDVRLANIFLTNRSKVLLNDWSSMQDANVET